ncbi:S-methyl-5'-thioadenosine phosphorylase [Nocardiopsis sp. L17-MgMaSL7]|uniref:S-methyl-5'-thioadenosine phosphorylase n=1 Tax=Nocardiopsis sp. L17-MgMaSL7 TaxID=1938893 RepID=UPI000D717FBE|nr:S-methyl-5'-thioadenosine phosphorylase [Nocardiopsis sp. L17-MgMaSL7]PWV58084.1 5'-methylthioadenosine phosphorylase [Nocardiopsis sp. L17-MgMaSL7]
MNAPSRPHIAVIGGSGFYHLFEDSSAPVTQIRPATPYGETSGPITIGEVAGNPVAFLPRHGENHRWPAHRINYRANLWALYSLGVRRIVAPCAVGSLDPSLGPGSIVVPDQLIDRTSGRPDTFYDQGAVHVSFADPYCTAGAEAVNQASQKLDTPTTQGGTMVVIQGPRFATRAESRFHASMGGSLVNMTAIPEASLARELAVCYTSVALVTDLDAGVDREQAVDQVSVFEVFQANLVRLRSLVATTAELLAKEDERGCACARALDGMNPPLDLPSAPAEREG